MFHSLEEGFDGFDADFLFCGIEDKDLVMVVILLFVGHDGEIFFDWFVSESIFECVYC